MSHKSEMWKMASGVNKHNKPETKTKQEGGRSSRPWGWVEGIEIGSGNASPDGLTFEQNPKLVKEVCVCVCMCVFRAEGPSVPG